MGKFELIKPTEELIKQYNRLWNSEYSEKDLTVQLFKDISINITKYSFSKEYIKSFSNDDKEIEKYCKNNDVEKFFYKLNSVYHTRLETKDIAAEWSLTDTTKTLDDLVELCKQKTGRYAYSFATKVFSFIAPDKYPIMDRYVVNMLKAYLSQSEESISTSSWGDYSKYVEAYDEFRNKYGLTKLTYKEIDEFLWMYGKLLQEYWKKEGVLLFDSTVWYKSKKENQKS